MKDITAVLLASLILLALIALLSADHTSDRTVFANQERVSDLGLRFAFRR